MAKSVTYTGATNTRAEQRQANARAACKGNDSRGGLLGRMAGARKGGAICDQGSEGGNAGSNAFHNMMSKMSSDHQIDWSRVSNE